MRKYHGIGLVAITRMGVSVVTIVITVLVPTNAIQLMACILSRAWKPSASGSILCIGCGGRGSSLLPLKLMTGRTGFQMTLLTSNLESYFTSPVPYGMGGKSLVGRGWLKIIFIYPGSTCSL